MKLLGPRPSETLLLEKVFWGQGSAGSASPAVHCRTSWRQSGGICGELVVIQAPLEILSTQHCAAWMKSFVLTQDTGTNKASRANHKTLKRGTRRCARYLKPVTHQAHGRCEHTASLPPNTSSRAGRTKALRCQATFPRAHSNSCMNHAFY